jgi:hypothetical protein
MQCDTCVVDKTVTIVTTIQLLRVNPRSGKERLETRTTRLCPACAGPDDAPDRRGA